MTTIHLVTFATEDYEYSQQVLSKSALNYGVDTIHCYSSQDLQKTNFYHQHKKILDQPKGAGFWLWKPYLILKTLKSVPRGDMVIYADAGIKIVNDLSPLIQLSQTHDIVLFRDPSGVVNHQYVKRDCFIAMKCDSKQCHDSPHIQAAFQVYKATPASIKIVSKWLRYSQDPSLLTDAPNTLGLPNLRGFIAHRHDQSILSLLVYKYQLPLFRDTSQYGQHLRYPNSTYGVLINHHRQRLQPFPLSALRFLLRCLPNRLHNILNSIADNLPPSSRKMDYQGVALFYRRGMAIIKHIVNGSYETDLIEAIKSDLHFTRQPVLVDIGANIGLVSIALHQQLPNLTIHAFEPGQIQSSLLYRTIQLNDIKKVVLHRLALGDKDKLISFASHEAKESSADGFLDTRRAGTTKMIEVNMSKLDTWWRQHNQPRVDVIKIDTEGSEYLVIKGAMSLIRKHHPIIYFEMQSENLLFYKHRPRQILKLLKDFGYAVSTLSDIALNRYNTADILLHHSMYVARPRAKH